MISLTCFRSQRTKYFGGQHFWQQVRFSAVLSAEILSDKVYYGKMTENNFRKHAMVTLGDVWDCSTLNRDKNPHIRRKIQAGLIV